MNLQEHRHFWITSQFQYLLSLKVDKDFLKHSVDATERSFVLFTCGVYFSPDITFEVSWLFLIVYRPSYVELYKLLI
jgi:hypothetical protein